MANVADEWACPEPARLDASSTQLVVANPGTAAAITASVAGCARNLKTPSVADETAHVALGLEKSCDVADATAVLDAWHADAAASRLEPYLAAMASDARFLGTDASETWSKDDLRRYATRPFAEGRGWQMRASTRELLANEARSRITAQELVWFDEALATVNLGPARGSGVLRCRNDGRFEIVHYVLSITVPNDRFPAVRALLEEDPPVASPDAKKTPAQPPASDH